MLCDCLQLTKVKVTFRTGLLFLAEALLLLATTPLVASHNQQPTPSPRSCGACDRIAFTDQQKVSQNRFLFFFSDSDAFVPLHTTKGPRHMLRTKSRHLTPAGSMYRVYQYDWDSVMGSPIPPQTVLLGSDCFHRPTTRSFQRLNSFGSPPMPKLLRVLTAFCGNFGRRFRRSATTTPLAWAAF